MGIDTQGMSGPTDPNYKGNPKAQPHKPMMVKPQRLFTPTYVKEMKIQAMILDSDITKYLSNAMLGPNKTFLDILIESEISDGGKISFVTNLTNSMQDSSKIILYLTIKNVIRN